MEKICDASLIATVFNEEDNILAFLDSIYKQTIYPNEFIILDGGSTDRTVEIILNFSKTNPLINIRLISDPKCNKKFIKGPIAHGRNIAISEARSEIIAVTDAGCVLENDWLENILDPFKDSNIDVVAGWYKHISHNRFSDDFAKALLPNLNKINNDNFLPSSRSIAFKKTCWHNVGGYPTDTYTAEDTYFVLQLKQAGYKFQFQKNAIVAWECPTSMKEALRKQFLYGQGDGLLGINRFSIIKMIINVMFPFKIIFSSLSPTQMAIKYLVLFANIIGYMSGVFKK